MTREELLNLVKKELGTYKLTLSEKTINEELDDELGDFGDDADANGKRVEKIAKRLKRMDGNLHKDVSTQVDLWKKDHDGKTKKDGENSEDGKKPEGDDKKEDAVSKELEELRKELNEMRDERSKERAEAAKKAVIDSVKKGLSEKFKKADIPLNDFFFKTSIQKLEVPDKDADVDSLVSKAEKLYEADLKAAGVEYGRPNSGGNRGGSKKEEPKDEFKDVANVLNRNS